MQCLKMMLKPIRTWSKPTNELNDKTLEQIRRGEMVEIPQGGDNPSKFMYKDMGGHLYWVALQPYEETEL